MELKTKTSISSVSGTKSEPNVEKNCTIGRSVQTRRLVLVEDNPDAAKVALITKIFKEILENLKDVLDGDGRSMISNFTSLPSKEDLPQYYCKISEPIDFSSIMTGLEMGSYHSVRQIDQDILLLLQNNIRFYGSFHRIGEYALALRKKYNELCTRNLDNLSTKVGQSDVQCLVRAEPMVTDEDIINCSCCQYKAELQWRIFEDLDLGGY